MSPDFLLRLAVFAVMAWLIVRIARKAGYSGWWVIPMLIPIANIVLVWIFAHARWPALRRPAPPSQSAGPPG